MDLSSGSAGNDTFTALSTTLTVGDVINGGAGTDTLNLTANLTDNASLGGYTLTSIENVSVNILDGDTANAEGLTLNMFGSTVGAVTLSGLGATTANDTLTLNNLAAGTNLALNNATDLNMTANFAAAATAGTADSVNLSLNAVTRTAATDVTVTVGAGFETMNVSTAGTASRVDQITFGGTTLNVAGSANLTIDTALDAALVTVDASTFTGNLSVAISDPAERTNPSTVDIADISVTGGSGNDTIDASAATTAARELHINAGAGNDTVTIAQVLANSSATNAGDILNGGDGNDTLAGDVDLFDAGTAGFTGTTALTGVTGFETLSVNGFAAEANTINVANISADLRAVTIASATSGNTTINFGTAGAYTVNVGGAAAILDDDTLIVDAGGTGTADALTIANTNAATGTAQMGANDSNITVTDFETVTINTGSYSTATAQLLNAINVGTNALVLTGSNGLTTTATTGIITAGTINASAMTGALTMNVAAASGVTAITGGSAADTLVGDAASAISGGAGNDTITGGTGNDVLNGDDGNDTITTSTGEDNVNGGAGNDTIVLGADASSDDSIDGGDGTDTLSLTNAGVIALGAFGITEANRFNTNLVNVERVLITDDLDATGDAFDMGRIDGIQHITLNDIGGDQTLSGLNSGATIVHADVFSTVTDVLTASVTGAATAASDVLNVELIRSADTDYGVLAVANVETLNINVTETTASDNIRAATIGLTISQATGGAAQTVNVTGLESLTVDTAIAARTISASGMTVVAATDSGLTMDAAFTATTAITGQTITGSGKVDVLRGSTGADLIDGGAGADAIHGGTGADTIDGGAGTDTYHTTGLVGATIEGTGTGTSTGVVINLGSTALTNATVLANIGQDLSGALTSVAAGQVAYVFNGSAPTNTAVVKTLSNIENVTLAGNGINYVVGSDAANSIVGGTGVDYIVGGLGADTINGGAEADTYVLTEATASADTIIFAGSASSVQTTDINNLVTGFAVANDIIDFTANTAFRHGGAALTGYAEGALGNIATAVGFQVFSTNITVADAAVGPTEAEMETYFDTNEVFFNGGTNDAVYVAVDNGAHTWILSLQSGGGNKVFTAASDDGVIVVRLTGMTDATTLSVANFADFTA